MRASGDGMAVMGFTHSGEKKSCSRPVRILRGALLPSVLDHSTRITFPHRLHESCRSRKAGESW